MTERYPDVKVTELIISETGATECKSCTDANLQTSDPNAPDYCNPEEKFFAYDFLDSDQIPVPIDVNSKNLWFKAGNCGSSMKIIEDNAQFQTTIFNSPKIDNATGIISTRTILATDITCDYPRSIDGFDMDPGANVVADGSEAK